MHEIKFDYVPGSVQDAEDWDKNLHLSEDWDSLVYSAAERRSKRKRAREGGGGGTEV